MKSFYYFNISRGTCLNKKLPVNKQLKQEYFWKHFVTSQQSDNLFTGLFNFVKTTIKTEKILKLVQFIFLKSFFKECYLQKDVQLNWVAVTGSTDCNEASLYTLDLVTH